MNNDSCVCVCVCCACGRKRELHAETPLFLLFDNMSTRNLTLSRNFYTHF